MKFLSALVLSMVFSFLTVIPAYCNDTIANDHMIGIAVGKIWNQRRNFDIQEVNVNEGKIEIVIVEMSPETETEIRKIVDPYDVTFVNEERQGKDAILICKKFNFTEGKTYVECEGMFFEIQNAPYVSNGFLMIPLRQAITVLNDSSDHNYKLKWMGGDNQMIEITANTNAGLIQISCKNNTITIIPFDDTYSLDGKIEIRDGVAYFPCSLENLKFIDPSIKITQDIEKMNIEIMS
ncbi:hypothetical protein [Anaerotignum propionicum]|uniref:hypothetical protein n=1 Tax=Anaerotignum propionicum TaxID=28446 RepID=UPI00210ED3C1|nr:hypothetical protein [Anaerotignum propionicum]MCQ4936717.1 hypothetical protein [Anaerotignum propionicum]